MSRLRRIFGRSGKATRWDLLKAIVYTQVIVVWPLLIMAYGFQKPWIVITVFALVIILTVVLVGPFYDAIYPQAKEPKPK